MARTVRVYCTGKGKPQSGFEPIDVVDKPFCITLDDVTKAIKKEITGELYKHAIWRVKEAITCKQKQINFLRGGKPVYWISPEHVAALVPEDVHLTSDAALALAVTLEYLIAETLELSGTTLMSRMDRHWQEYVSAKFGKTKKNKLCSLYNHFLKK